MSENYKTLFQQIDDKDQSLLVKVVNDHERDIKEERIINRTTFTNTCVNNVVTTNVYAVAYLASKFAIPTVNSVVRIGCESTDDSNDVSKQGAKRILISGLGANLIPVEEIVSLNGTTPVLTTISFFRINFVKVIETGNKNFNQGWIFVGSTSGSFSTTTGFSTGNYACMLKNDNYVGNCLYTVPFGQKVYNLRYRLSTNGTGNLYKIQVFYRENPNMPFVLYDANLSSPSRCHKTLRSKAVTGEFLFKCFTLAGSGTRICNITYCFDVIKNNYDDSVDFEIF